MPDYFTLEEFRDLPSMDDDGKYPDEDVERAAGYITAIVERFVGTSFVPRTFTKKLSGTGSDVSLPSPFVLEVTGVDDGDVAQTGPFEVDNGSLIGPWSRGIRNLTVTYDAGYSDEPPADIKEAVMQAARARLLEKHGSARVQDRTQSVSNNDGGTTTFVLAGPDHPTGYPEVDAVLVGYRRRLFGLGYI
jgi:hypothetical protein